MISILIPTYEQKGQGAAMLSILLKSITDQIFTDPFEVVISDNAIDGSIKQVCGYFPNLPIRYQFNPVRGASENINAAIDLAKYDKVKLMMQDDVFASPMGLRLFSDALDRGGWAISNSVHINDKGLKTGQRIATYVHGNFDNNTVGMPSVIGFKKTDLRFDTRLKTFCDVYFYYQLYELYGPPQVITDFAIGQRFHNASLSRNQAPSHQKDKNFLLRSGLIKGAKAPRIVVAVVVYDRWGNLERWARVWQRCNTVGAELVFIHNIDEGETGLGWYNNIKIISRRNVGFDIGAFQDVCKGMLPGFPEYDFLLWVTDDTIPMDPDFISAFVDPFEKHIGLTCMQISREVTRHVRTTGFCIKKEVATRLRFPADPITTVQQCWHFEHRGGPNTLLKQIEVMRLHALQISPLETSPLYDMGFWYRNEQAKKLAHLYDRMAEHEKIFSTLPQKETA